MAEHCQCVAYSSGAVEGNVGRLKMLKRQMYGRANLDMLRKRVLLAREAAQPLSRIVRHNPTHAKWPI